LEVIAATFVLVVAVIGCYLAFSGIISQISFISSKQTAAYLAQEGLEIVRNIRDTNWLQDSTLGWDNFKAAFSDKNCSSGCEADYKTGTSGQLIALRSYGSGSLLMVDADGFYNYSSGTATKFKRKITVSPANPDVVQVSVQVSWSDKGQSYNFTVAEDLYNWK